MEGTGFYSLCRKMGVLAVVNIVIFEWYVELIFME